MVTGNRERSSTEADQPAASIQYGVAALAQAITDDPIFASRLDQLGGGGADPAGIVGHVLGLPPCLSPPTYKLNAAIAAPNE
ncbi:MAG: hypothetical protein ACM30D_04100 [Hyphomicrobiales bacterium]